MDVIAVYKAYLTRFISVQILKVEFHVLIVNQIPRTTDVSELIEYHSHA